MQTLNDQEKYFISEAIYFLNRGENSKDAVLKALYISCRKDQYKNFLDIESNYHYTSEVREKTCKVNIKQDFETSSHKKVKMILKSSLPSLVKGLYDAISSEEVLKYKKHDNSVYNEISNAPTRIELFILQIKKLLEALKNIFRSQ